MIKTDKGTSFSIISYSRPLILVCLALGLTVPFTAGAQYYYSNTDQITIVQLQNQITALEQQIASLVSQLQQQTQYSSLAYSNTVACDFSRNLYIGIFGNDVLCLEQYLNLAGFSIASPGAPGSAGYETIYYSNSTAQAVMRWQSANGLPASGVFDEKARATYLAIRQAGGAVSGAYIDTSSYGYPIYIYDTYAYNPYGSTQYGVLNVNLDNSMNLTSNISSGAIKTPVFQFSLQNNSGSSISVNQLQFSKNGSVSDGLINNVFIADENGSAISPYVSVFGGTVIFPSANISLNPGQSRHFTLRLDLSSGTGPGHAFSWQLNSLQVSNGLAVYGLPITGNTFTVTANYAQNYSTVYIQNMQFIPSVMTVGRGMTVTWTNNDNMLHTVTADQGFGPSSGMLTLGSSYSYVFNTTGTFNYYCSLHPFMRGTVTVLQ